MGQGSHPAVTPRRTSRSNDATDGSAGVRSRAEGPPDTATSLDGQALVDFLAQQIHTRIMNGELPLGTRLRQEALADSFGVSRTPVREALRQLQSTSVVEVQPRRGAIIRGPSARDIREAYFIRAELEGAAAELAADMITDNQLDRLHAAADLFRKAVEHSIAAGKASSARTLAGAEWPEANDRFHEVILEAAGNNRLYETVTSLHLQFPRNLTWAALNQSSRALAANAKQHDAILRAIEQHNTSGARREMRSHVSRAGELVVRHFWSLRSE